MGPDQPLRLTRRQLLAGGAAAAGALALARLKGLSRLWRPAEIAGGIVGPSRKLGHLLRSGVFPAPTASRKTGVVVVGGGVSGLSAGWKLQRAGYKDFEVLELEGEPGGNSRWGSNAVSAYPWGAHYVPFPSPESKIVSELFLDLGVEIGRDAKGRPVYDDRFICFAPESRIYVHGRWQEGLVPREGATGAELAQFGAFDREMARWRRRRGADGRRAFAIPMELSSRDPELLALDRLSMREWLRRNGFDSPRMRWLVEYACRDDFGSTLEDTSAWAGLHYYASRGEREDAQVLTWPEGNGWLARRLAERLGPRVRTGVLAFDLDETSSGVRVDVLDAATGKASRIEARAAVVCLPQFAAARVYAPWRRRRPDHVDAFHYAPWMVANLTIEEPPEGKGYPQAWDNVLFDSDSLGYVIATHQSLSQDRRGSVWTYYKPFPQPDDKAARRRAYETPWSSWRDAILADLSRPHPDIREHVRRIDVMVWGHGMVKPKVGFLWGAARREAARPRGKVFFGHSDLSGFSIFEEAQYRGVVAAEGAMRLLGHAFASSI